MTLATAIERYTVRSYEVDHHGRLAATALCNYLQESAGLHARKLGVSVEQLLAQGMTWFLWRLHLEVERLPRWGETVTVETWPAELGKPFAIRDFRIRVEGQEIGVATTAWLLMDTARNRPIRRLPASIRDLHPDPPNRALEDSFRRLPPCEDTHYQRVFTVRRGDLDLNAHLNHVATIGAMLEAVPSEVAGEHRLEALEVEFRGEGRHGDVLEAHCGREDDGGRWRHALNRHAGGKELARARSSWHRT